VARRVSRAQRAAARCVRGVALGGLGLALAACSLAGEPELPAAETLARQRAAYDAEVPKSILDLQPWRTETRAALSRSDGAAGEATLINLNPYAGSWYLLSIAWPGSGGAKSWHLENPERHEPFTLRGDDPHALVLARGAHLACALWVSEGRGALEDAGASGLPYAPLCSGALYLRNPVAGHHTSLERVADFLRDHVWGGDRIVNFVKQEFYRDAFLEKGAVSSATAAAAAPLGISGPLPAALAPETAGQSVTPARLALELASGVRALEIGQWYAVRDLPGVAVSVIAPEYLESRLRAGREPNVNALDSVESGALAYLVAFELGQLELHFVLGTDHPRLDWSERPPPASRDPRLPGPDGVATAAPLVTNGMVSPADAERTIAAFAGGFKRSHGAFRVGPLAGRNHGSHYGFIEEGVIFSKLQPGLATALVMDDGAVDLRTWSADEQQLLPRIRYARQNGVPLLEYDAASRTGVPGEYVNRWGPGNWSGSAEEVLRTVRAGLCLQENGARRFLVYGYFSSATPSAMARVFQGYQCRYAMHLDMNALEHTYLALYVRRNRQLLVEHLIDGMQEVDRSSGNAFAPRFLAFPDDRDFFYVTRRGAP
jgi:hypothetical protein